MGLNDLVIPAGNLTGLKIRQQGLKIVGVSNVLEAMEAVFI
jgi:DNA repair protein RadA/Sms